MPARRRSPRRRPCRRRSLHRSLIRRPAPECPGEGADWPRIRRRRIRSRPPAPLRRVRSRRSMARDRAAPRSSSAPATRSMGLAHRYNVTPAAILQANGYKGPARAVAGPATDHSAPRARPRRCAAPRSPRRRPSRLPRRRPPSAPCRQSRRYAAEHRAPQPHVGGRTRQGQQHRCCGKAQTRHQADRARRKTAAARLLRSRQPSPRAACCGAAPPATKMAAAPASRKVRGWLRPPASEEPSAESTGQGRRGHRRAADLPLAGARQGHHQLRRQDQRQVQ